MNRAVGIVVHGNFNRQDSHRQRIGFAEFLLGARLLAVRINGNTQAVVTVLPRSGDQRSGRLPSLLRRLQRPIILCHRTETPERSQPNHRYRYQSHHWLFPMHTGYEKLRAHAWEPSSRTIAQLALARPSFQMQSRGTAQKPNSA